MAQSPRRQGDRVDKDYRATRSDSGVTWKWLAGSAFGLIVLGGGGWMTYVQGQISGTVVALEGVKEKVNKQAVDQATSTEQMKALNKSVDEVKKDVQDIRSDLKLILQNQQQQILNQQSPARRP